MHLSFLLPRDNRSGGVRVTAIMAQLLREKGYNVRIICIDKPSFASKVRSAIKNKFSSKNTGWLHIFKGPVEWPSHPQELTFQDKEIVIGVGTYTLSYLINLPDNLIKLRFNHGLPAKFTEKAIQCWSYNLPSITVSRTLVPNLEELSPGSVMGVVPNGIDPNLYHDKGLQRDGIGVFYSKHPNKAPDFIVKVVQQIRRDFPETPLHVISTTQIPSELDDIVEFHHYPSVERVCEIYNKCRVWLLPSDTEGLPGPVLEAMSCGTVVVSTDNDGSLEIIEPEVNGLISPRRDLESFVKNVDRAFNDDVLRERLAKAGHKRAEEFSWDAAVTKMETILAKLKSSKEA